MARRRLQSQGSLYKQGNYWKLRWREDAIDAKGAITRPWSKPVWLGPCAGPGALTKKQARRIAWDNFLSKIDQNNPTPQTLATLNEFVRRKFRPEHIAFKKKNTRITYESLLRSHILPILGNVKLRDIGREQVQGIISNMIEKKLAPQTIHPCATLSAPYSILPKTAIGYWESGAARPAATARTGPAPTGTLAGTARKDPGRAERALPIDR